MTRGSIAQHKTRFGCELFAVLSKCKAKHLFAPRGYRSGAVCYKYGALRLYKPIEENWLSAKIDPTAAK
ncbi:unnamed protein product [Allacma fusca]|uniref:Uncharacterized protein n=1 Tax=Allacma fusca TaxID=39272 RepID=A0A8J2KMD2_9HEXA|nr:unnamed protein product [Allacma fusca]